MLIVIYIPNLNSHIMYFGSHECSVRLNLFFWDVILTLILKP